MFTKEEILEKESNEYSKWLKRAQTNMDIFLKEDNLLFNKRASMIYITLQQKTKTSYHAIGDHYSRCVRRTWEESGWVSGVHDQRLLVSHF
jgi:hypothetical protein